MSVASYGSQGSLAASSGDEVQRRKVSVQPEPVPSTNPPAAAQDLLSKKPMGPIVAVYKIASIGLEIPLDADLRDQAIAGGMSVELIGGCAPPPIFPAAPAPPPKRAHRATRKEKAAPPAVKESRAAIPAPQDCAVVPALEAPPVRSHKSATALCTQCTRAMTAVERMRISNEGYKNAFEYYAEQLPEGSEARSTALEVSAAAGRIAQQGLLDAQAVLRDLACSKDCLRAPGKKPA